MRKARKLRTALAIAMLGAAAAARAGAASQDSVPQSEAWEEVSPKVLQEVTVEADRSQTVTRLANGQRFYLSKEAKEMKDPFMALREIPLLISDPALSKVTTLDGKSPLIQIDGMDINSGIRPILPAEIEWVEVIETVPAKYLAQGITSIVNIKLRKDRAPYVWVEGATRHDIPIGKGFGVGYFEVGNPKVSLYGRAAVSYTHDLDENGETERENEGYRQSYRWSTVRNGHDVLGELLLKWAPTQKDRFALQCYATSAFFKVDEAGEGETVTAGEESPYYSSGASRSRSTLATSSLFYRRVFSKGEHAQATVSYNYNRDRLSTASREEYADGPFLSDALFSSRRNSVRAQADYVKTLRNGGSLWIGCTFSGVFDRIGHSGLPVFRHRNVREYFYGAWSGSAGKLKWMVSPGFELARISCAGASFRFAKPRATASATWSFSDRHSVDASYLATNTLPSVGQLNPYDTSTDSLVESRGNPGLKPETMQSAKVGYTFNRGGLYVSPYFRANFYRKVITASGYTTPDGVYVSTYDNLGRYTDTNAGVNASLRLGPSRLSGGAIWIRKFYRGLSPRDELYVRCGWDWTWGKVRVYANVSYQPKAYTDISVTREYSPSEATIQVNYSITENLYVAAWCQLFEYKTKTRMADGSFRSLTVAHYPDKGFHPWILVRWNMRKRAEKKIPIENGIGLTDPGITLKQLK